MLYWMLGIISMVMAVFVFLVLWVERMERQERG